MGNRPHCDNGEAEASTSLASALPTVDPYGLQPQKPPAGQKKHTECSVAVFDPTDPRDNPDYLNDRTTLPAGGIDWMCGAVALAGAPGTIPAPANPHLLGAMISLAMLKQNCDCVKTLYIVGHGNNEGEVRLGSELLTVGDVDMICPFLCDDATVELVSCHSGANVPGKYNCVNNETGEACLPTAKSDVVPSLQLILDNCTKVSAVVGCLGNCQPTPPPPTVRYPCRVSSAPKNHPVPTCKEWRKFTRKESGSKRSQ
jgi:hypothetical protein